MKRMFVCVGLAALLAACGGETDSEPAEPGAVRGDSPLVGKADGSDKADRECSLVLREVSRIANGPGFETSPAGDWVWRASIDVAEDALDGGASVHLLYSSNASNDPEFGRVWWTVEAEPIQGAPDGFRRFEARVIHGVFGPGISATTLRRTTLDVIPYLANRGSRLFDHNRVPGDLDTYALRFDNGWSVGDDAAICQPQAPRAPAWIGNPAVKFERGNSHPCSGARAIEDSDKAFTYEGWARQRAVVRSFCFEVWEPGVTDWDNPNLWKDLDVQIHYRRTGDSHFWTEHVSLSDWTGNNARYGFDLGALDAFGWPNCPSAVIVDDHSAVVELKFYVTVNDQTMTGFHGEPFVGRYTEHVSNWEQRCGR